MRGGGENESHFSCVLCGACFVCQWLRLGRRPLLVFALFFLVGCGRSSPPKLEVWTISLRPKFTTYMEETLGAWQKEHPDIHVEWIDLPLSAIQQKLVAGLISSHPPALVNLNTDMALQLAEMGVLLDLDDVVSPKDQSLYFPKLWDSVRYNDRHYAFPWYVSTQLLMYNTAIYKEAGLDPLHPPESWQELVNQSIIIKQKTNLYGWLPAIKFLDDLRQEGIPVISADGKKALFDSPQAVKRLQTYVTLFKEGYLPRETLELSKAYQDAVNLYQGGKLAILQTGPQFLSRVKDNAPSIYKVTEVAPLPAESGKSISAATMNWVIPKNALFKKEAISLALFLTNDKNQLAFSQLALVYPSTQKAASDPFFQGSDLDSLMAKARRIGAEELKMSEDFTIGLKNGKARNEAIRDAMESALLGKKSPYDALHEAAQLWDQLLN